MNRPNSRFTLQYFKIIEILHKAYKNYFHKPTGVANKNHYYWREKKFFDYFLEANRNDPTKLRLKKSYINAIDTLIKDFNQVGKGHCRLTKHNLFAFLLILAETCAKNKKITVAKPGLKAYLEDDIDENDPTLSDVLYECLQEAAQSLFFCHMCQKYCAIQLPNLFCKWNRDKLLYLFHILLFLQRSKLCFETCDLP